MTLGSAPQAIVLAAGLGRRMRPLTDATHKALLPIAGTTILSRIVDGLCHVGVSDITVVTGYRADEVVSYLEGLYPTLRFQFVENTLYETTNNIVSLALAFELMDLHSDVLLLECDLIFEPTLLERLIDRSGNIALVDRYRTGMDGTVVSVEGGVVTKVFPSQLQGADFDFSDKYKTLNIYRFDREFCRSTLYPLLDVYSKQIDSDSYYELVLGMLANVPTHRIAAEMVAGDSWAEVDNPNDLAVAQFRFEPERRAGILDASHGGHWALPFRDFGFMHNVHFPTPAMIAALRHALPDLLGSYGSSEAQLKEKLALFVGCSPEHLQPLNGASQAYPILATQFASLTAAIPIPTFGEFRRAFPSATTYADKPGVDLVELERLGAQVELLVIVTPNNPTGTVIDPDWIYGFADSHPRTTVLVDESFIGFSDVVSLLSRLEHAPLDNLVVLTSLSKVLGVPGLRLGYLYSTNRSWLEDLARHVPIWNLSSVTEHFIELLVRFRSELSSSIEMTKLDRAAMLEALAAVPGIAEVYSSGGNFVLVRLRGDRALAARVRESLLSDAAIEVKDVSDRFLDAAPRLRVAVRSHEENLLLVACFKRMLAGRQ